MYGAPLLFVATVCRNHLYEVASMETVMDLSAPQNELFHFEVNHIYVTCQLKRNALTKSRSAEKTKMHENIKFNGEQEWAI